MAADTEPLDLDAVYDRWIDWYNGAPNPDRWRHRDADESMSHCLAREDVPALMAEVQRLREKLAHRHQDYWTRDALERAGRSKEIRCTPDCAPDYMVVYR